MEVTTSFAFHALLQHIPESYRVDQIAVLVMVLRELPEEVKEVFPLNECNLDEVSGLGIEFNKLVEEELLLTDQIVGFIDI
jgi:hypothetical protein